MQARNNNYDLLKCVAMLLVLMIHVAAPIITTEDFHLEWPMQIAQCLSVCCRVAVPLFIMVSGYFCISGTRVTNLSIYYKRLYNKIIPPIIIASAIAAVYIVVFDSNTVRDFIFDIIAGVPYYHLWYLFMAIGLYAITPFLILIKEIYGEKTLLFIGIIFIILSIPAAQFAKIYWCYQFILYLGYFILGYSLPKIKSIQGRPLLYFLSYAIISLLTCLIVIYTEGHRLSSSIISYLSPTIILASICLFMFFSNLPQKSFSWYRIAKYSLNFYILHAFILTTFNKSLIYLEIPLDSWGIYYIPIAFIFVALITFSALYCGGNSLLEKMYTYLMIKSFSFKK